MHGAVVGMHAIVLHDEGVVQLAHDLNLLLQRLDPLGVADSIADGLTSYGKREFESTVRQDEIKRLGYLDGDAPPLVAVVEPSLTDLS